LRCIGKKDLKLMMRTGREDADASPGTQLVSMNLHRPAVAMHLLGSEMKLQMTDDEAAAAKRS
jgi:hypothetical protein